jgi:aminocarboxymuconate-semialdehyde decarboxylase
MIIDFHAHLVPASLVEAIRRAKQQFPAIRVIEGAATPAFSFAGGNPTRPIAKPLIDMAARADWMAKQKIERQLVGGWLDMFGYEIPAAEGARWSNLVNEHLAAACKSDSRFVALASVPLQNGAEAARELRDAHAAGFRGVMIGTQPKGVGGVLDDPDLDPFWKEANRLASIVFVHPVYESGDNRVHDYGMANAVGRATDTLIAVSRLIYSGHVLRYSDVKMIIPIGGCAIPFVLGRLRRNYQLASKELFNPDPAVRALFYDTVLHEPRALRFLADVVGGADRILMGSDMPFPIGDEEPLQIVDAAGFTAQEKQSINGGLAQRLLAL